MYENYNMKVSKNIISFISTLFLLSGSISFAETPLIVKVTPLSKLLIEAKNSAPANIISLNHSTISAEITGQTLKIKIETGDVVSKGQQLASLDCRSYFLAKKQAEARLKVAKTQLNYSDKQFKRNQRLLKKGIIPRETFEKAEAGKLTALADIQLQKASIEATKLSINRCNIKAPFSGQITKRIVQIGQLVTPGTPLFQLMQTDNLEIRANLSPADVQKLDDSPIIEFIVAKERIKAVVRSVIQNINEISRTQEVRLSLPKNTKVSAGLSGRIEWRNKERQLPSEHLIRRNSILGVMIAEDIVEGIGIAKFHHLVEAREGQPIVVALPDNTTVITKNQYRVKSGQSIEIE